jgi:hypothetical protein
LFFTLLQLVGLELFVFSCLVFFPSVFLQLSPVRLLHLFQLQGQFKPKESALVMPLIGLIAILKILAVPLDN